MKYLKRFAWGALFCAMPLGAEAASFTTASTALAFPLENQGASARAVAMGSAFVGVSGDASALFWNPAALSTISRAQLALHHNFYLQDFLQETLVFALPPGPMGSWGLTASYLSYGALPGRDGNGALTGNVEAGRWGGEIAWAASLAPKFFLGLGLKGHLLNLAGTSYSNIAGDAGLLFEVSEDFHLGASYANLGTNVNAYPADSVVRWGGSYGLKLSSSQRVLLAAAAAWEPQGVARLHFGAEDQISSFLSLRAGYVLDLSTQNLQGLTGLTAGLGFQIKDFVLDYAYNPFGDLGSSQKISLTYQFGGAAVKEKPASDSQPRVQPLLPAPEVIRPQAGTVTVFAAPPSPTPGPLEPKKDSEKLRLLFSLPDSQPAPAAADSDWDKKVQDRKDAIDKNPKDESAWYELGMLYYQKAQKDDALQCFDQVLRLKPGNQKLKDWLTNYKSRQP